MLMHRRTDIFSNNYLFFFLCVFCFPSFAKRVRAYESIDNDRLELRRRININNYFKNNESKCTNKTRIVLVLFHFGNGFFWETNEKSEKTKLKRNYN